MTDHMHCIVRAKNGNLPAILRDMKRPTASKIIKAMSSATESRKDWMLKRFKFATRKNSRDSFISFGHMTIMLYVFSRVISFFKSWPTCI